MSSLDTSTAKNFKLLFMMIQHRESEEQKKKITEFPRASYPYAELLKLYIFIHKKTLQIKVEMIFYVFSLASFL